MDAMTNLVAGKYQRGQYDSGRGAALRAVELLAARGVTLSPPAGGDVDKWQARPHTVAWLADPGKSDFFIPDHIEEYFGEADQGARRGRGEAARDMAMRGLRLFFSLPTADDLVAAWDRGEISEGGLGHGLAYLNYAGLKVVGSPAIARDCCSIP